MVGPRPVPRQVLSSIPDLHHMIPEHSFPQVLNPDIADVLRMAELPPFEGHWTRMTKSEWGQGTPLLFTAPFHGKMETGSRLSATCVQNQWFGIACCLLAETTLPPMGTKESEEL